MKLEPIPYDSINSIINYKKKDLFSFIVTIWFVCSPMISAFFRFVLPDFAARESLIIAVNDNGILFLVVFTYLARYKTLNRKLAIWPIYMIAFGAIVWSLIFNPEYKDWFNHSEYGLSLTIFHMTCAVFGTLIFSLFTDRKKMLTALVYGCRLNLVYYIYQYSLFLRRGYWESYMGDGTLARTDYGLNYGYNVVMCVILFMILYTYNKKKIDLISFVISLLLVIICGSRGPLICIAISMMLLFIYRWNRIQDSKIKLIIFLLFMTGILSIMVIGIPVFVSGIASILRKSDISSRALQMFLNGTLADDSGRNRIYKIAYKMIAAGDINSFLGYGFYGDRYVIGRTWFYGYPHNIFLELLIQYGILFGGIIILMLVFNILRMAIRCEDSSWQLLFITLLGTSIKLCLSDSFWYYWPFWALLAVIGSWNKEQKHRNRSVRFKW